MDDRQRQRLLDDSFAALRMVRRELDGLGSPESEEPGEAIFTRPWSSLGFGTAPRGAVPFRDR